MTILVTGARGLVGSRIVSHLLAEGQPVIACVRPGRQETALALFHHRARGAVFEPSPTLVEVDLEQPEAVERLIESHAPTAVIHGAAMTNVDACEREPGRAALANHAATAAVARACGRVGARLVSLSTDYVFDGTAGPYAEDDVPNPVGVYASTKRQGELEVLAALDRGADCLVVRVASIFGGLADDNPNFGRASLEALRRGDSIRAFVDQWVSPTWSGNAASMCLAALRSGAKGILHCAGGDIVSRVEFATVLAERAGFDAGRVVAVAMASVPLAIPRPARVGLVVDRARALFGTAGPMGIRDAIGRLVDEFGR